VKKRTTASGILKRGNTPGGEFGRIQANRKNAKKGGNERKGDCAVKRSTQCLIFLGKKGLVGHTVRPVSEKRESKTIKGRAGVPEPCLFR